MIAIVSKTCSRIIGLFVILGLAGTATASLHGASLPEKTLSLQQAIDIALEQNPDLLLAANRSRSTDIAWKKQRGSFLPDLSLSSSGNRQAGKSVDPVSGDYTASAYTRFSLNLSSSLTLFNGFANTSTLYQARENRDAAQAELSRTRQGIAYSVASEFVRSLTSLSFMSVEMENHKAQSALLKQVSAFYQAGRRSVADLYQQQAEIAASEYRLQEAQRSYQEATIALLQSLGMDPGLEVRLKEPPVDRMVMKLRAVLEDPSTAAAEIMDRPDLAAQENRVASARYSVRAARSGYYPRLSASAGVGSSYSSAIPGSDLEDQLLDRNLSASISLNLAVPLFDRGQTRQEVAAAKIQLDNEKVNLERQRRQVAAEVRQAELNFESASRQLTSANTQLKYAMAALDSVEDRYRANAATLSEVSQSRALYRQARYNHVASRYTLLLRGLEILYSRGDEESLLALVTESSMDHAAAPAAQGEDE
ncbi:MAG: TolC family protein [Candidatus Aminicenantes bacterium]|nr:TolC family protein [Candidatus Aminicenantes bacterium]